MRQVCLRRRFLLPTMLSVSLAATVGCAARGESIRLAQDNRALRDSNARLERTIVRREATIARARRQVRELTGFAPDRPVDLFAPVKLEIASLTGGRDYDGEPGDDGVTVHVRPLDAEGDAVKAPGRFKIQLLDNSVFGSPRALGTYVFDSAEQLRKAWHGRFGTNHYTFKCSFPPGVALPTTPAILVDVEFVDYLTGATLKAVKQVTITRE